MGGIFKDMIFFRKKKPEPPPEPAKKKAAEPAKKPKAESLPVPKPSKSLQDMAHTRVLTAEGWRRLMEKKLPKKAK